MTEPSPEKKVPRILICEDEIVIARDLARTLKNLGYEIAGMASTGNQAVQIAEESRTDLILMDINLDGEIDGIETTEQIRAKLDVPVVYLTGYAEKDVLERAKKTRPYGYLAKPCGLLELRGTIETALYKHEADRRVRESEERLRSSWETLHDFVFVVNSEGVFTDYHQPPDLQKLYAPPHEFLGRNYRDVLPQDVARSLREAINAVQQRDSVAQFDYQMVISGQKEWFSAKVSKRKSHSGEFAGVTIVCRDITDRKHAEEALRVSEELYRVLVETTNTGYVVVDGEGRVLAANPEYVRLTGHDTMEEILGRSVVEWTAEHDRERNAAEVEKCLREGVVRNLEIDYMDPNGGLVPIEVNATVVDGSDGRRIMSICREISDRRKSEQSVNAQRDLGVALSGVSDLQEAFALCIGTAVQISGMELAGIYVVEEDSGFHLVAHHGLSREFLRKVEYFPEESPEARIVATGLPVYYCGHHPEMSFSVIEALRGEGIRAGAVIPVVHQGEIVASLALCSRTFDEVPAHTRTALETISSQIGAALSRIRAESAVRKVKEELQESELRYREVVDLANEGIVVIQNGTMVLANRKAGEVTGRSGDELLATPILDMIHPDDRELLLDQHKMRMRGFSGPVEYTFRILGKAGDLRWLQMRTSLISWGGRNATLGLLSDITHSKRLEEELRESLAVASRLRVEAEAASTAKSEFLATMSHELRTPLNAIIGFSELLEAQAFGDLNDKQMDSVTEVLSAGHRLLDLINDVLDLAKVESGRMELEISSVNLSELLRDCLSLIAGEAVRKRIVVDLSVDETMGDSDVRIDGGKVRQVVCNLLSNAVKFTPKGGRIGVEAVKDRGDLVVSVSDTGIGIRPEDRQQIFQKFVQLDSTLSRRYKGTGLGLALSRTFVELQGGRIWFESEGLGQGSTFRFRIPLCGHRLVEHPGQADMAITDAREEPESAMQPSDMTPASPRKILVVEDDPASMKLVAGILEAHGYEVLRATDAEVGIRLAETQAPALILMDVSLPGLDGIAATRSLKQGPGTRDIPIIAVTAHAMKGDEERIRSEGCAGYLPKPIAHKALLEMVEKHLTQ